MKLLLVTSAFDPYLERGGPAVKVRTMARGLAAGGHQVTVLTVDWGPRNADAAQPSNGHTRRGWESHEGGVEAIYLPTVLRYRALTWNPAVSRFCAERLPEFDVAHIFGLYDLLGPAVASSCRRLGIPYVVEPMGMFRPIVRSLRLKRLYHRWLGGTMLRGARRIVATAEQEREELVAGGIAAEKIAIRRNGIEVPERRPARGMFRQAQQIPSRAKLILFLGRLVSKKSPDLLLEAFARWRSGAGSACESVLVLAGPDEGDGYRQRLETLSKRLGLNGGVLLPGPLFQDAKWAAYQDADVFVLPSQNENFGNAVGEAVVCDTPVIVTECCGIAPLVKDRAGLVISHDSAALAEALAQMLGDDPLRRKLSQGCAEVARGLTWREPLALMEALYQELAEAAARP